MQSFRLKGSMTAAELVWLDKVSGLHKTMDQIVQDFPKMLTAKGMRTLGEKLSQCAATLGGFGPPTDRFQPVYDLAKAGCAQYKKAADCFATAASYGITVSGSANDRKQQEAILCGFTAPGDGSQAFAEAEVKGFDIQQATR